MRHSQVRFCVLRRGTRGRAVGWSGREVGVRVKNKEGLFIFRVTVVLNDAQRYEGVTGKAERESFARGQTLGNPCLVLFLFILTGYILPLTC